MFGATLTALLYSTDLKIPNITKQMVVLKMILSINIHILVLVSLSSSYKWWISSCVWLNPPDRLICFHPSVSIPSSPAPRLAFSLLSMRRYWEYFCELLFLFFVQKSLTAGLSSFFFCWLSINSWSLFFCCNRSFDYTKCRTTQLWATKKGVFNNYLLCVFGKSETSVVSLTETAPKQF